MAMNPQQLSMVGMHTPGGPVGGTPMMQSASNGGAAADPTISRKSRLNTYIYDYFLRCGHYDIARAMYKASKSSDKNIQLVLDTSKHPSPGGGELNGAGDGMDTDSKVEKRPADLPNPGQKISEHPNCFLEDWWGQFWDIYDAQRNKTSRGGVVGQYIHANYHAFRSRQSTQTQMLQQGNAQIMGMYGRPGQNGMTPNDVAKQAMFNRGSMNSAMMAQMRNRVAQGQMVQNGIGMEMGDQRSQSPSVGADAPSPSKRPRMDGNFNQQMQSGRIQGMPGQPGGMPGMAGQMMLQNGMDPSFAAMHNGANKLDMGQGSPPNADGTNGNHALQDYQMQLMLLEQQNKKRLLMARQEQEATPQTQVPPGTMGGPHFATGMSPQGSRNGPSPNPSDMQKRVGTPKIPAGGLPGSPANTDGSGNVSQLYGMPQNMMRPPSSLPGYPMPNMPAGLTQAQMMEAQRRMPNGQMFAGPSMIPQGAQHGPNGPQQPVGQPAQVGTPRQQPNSMPPPPAPAGDQAGRANPPSPAAQPPTPSQTKGTLPKNSNKKKEAPKKNANKGKNAAAAAAAAAAATPASEAAEPPTPTPPTPITPMHPSSFNGGQQKNGAQQSAASGAQQGAQSGAPGATSAPAQQAVADTSAAVPFGDLVGVGVDSGFGLDPEFGGADALENFDFDSFLQTDEGNSYGFGDMMVFGGGDGVEAVGDL